MNKKRGIVLVLVMLLVVSLFLGSVVAEEHEEDGLDINDDTFTSLGYDGDISGPENFCDKNLDRFITSAFSGNEVPDMDGTDDSCDMDTGRLRAPSNSGCWFLVLDEDPGQDAGGWAQVDEGQILDSRKARNLDITDSGWGDDEDSYWFEDSCDGDNDAWDCMLTYKFRTHNPVLCADDNLWHRCTEGDGIEVSSKIGSVIWANDAMYSCEYDEDRDPIWVRKEGVDADNDGYTDETDCHDNPSLDPVICSEIEDLSYCEDLNLYGECSVCINPGMNETEICGDGIDSSCSLGGDPLNANDDCDNNKDACEQRCLVGDSVESCSWLPGAESGACCGDDGYGELGTTVKTDTGEHICLSDDDDFIGHNEIPNFLEGDICGDEWCWIPADAEYDYIITLKHPFEPWQDVVSTGDKWSFCSEETRGAIDTEGWARGVTEGNRFYCYEEGDRSVFADCVGDLTAPGDERNGVKARRAGDGYFSVNPSNIDSADGIISADFFDYSVYNGDSFVDVIGYDHLEFDFNFTSDIKLPADLDVEIFGPNDQLYLSQKALAFATNNPEIKKDSTIHIKIPIKPMPKVSLVRIKTSTGDNLISAEHIRFTKNTIDEEDAICSGTTSSRPGETAWFESIDFYGGERYNSKEVCTELYGEEAWLGNVPEEGRQCCGNTPGEYYATVTGGCFNSESLSSGDSTMLVSFNLSSNEMVFDEPEPIDTEIEVQCVINQEGIDLSIAEGYVIVDDIDRDVSSSDRGIINRPNFFSEYLQRALIRVDQTNAVEIGDELLTIELGGGVISEESEIVITKNFVRSLVSTISDLDHEFNIKIKEGSSIDIMPGRVVTREEETSLDGRETIGITVPFEGMTVTDSCGIVDANNLITVSITYESWQVDGGGYGYAVVTHETFLQFRVDFPIEYATAINPSQHDELTVNLIDPETGARVTSTVSSNPSFTIVAEQIPREWPARMEQIEEVYTFNCNQPECIFPLAGEYPYKVTNLHPELYDMSYIVSDFEHEDVLITGTTRYEGPANLRVKRVPQQVLYDGDEEKFFGCFASADVETAGGIYFKNEEYCAVHLDDYYCSPSSIKDGTVLLSSWDNTELDKVGYEIDESGDNIGEKSFEEYYGEDRLHLRDAKNVIIDGISIAEIDLPRSHNASVVPGRNILPNAIFDEEDEQFIHWTLLTGAIVRFSGTSSGSTEETEDEDYMGDDTRRVIDHLAEETRQSQTGGAIEVPDVDLSNPDLDLEDSFGDFIENFRYPSVQGGTKVNDVRDYVSAYQTVKLDFGEVLLSSPIPLPENGSFNFNYNGSAKGYALPYTKDGELIDSAILIGYDVAYIIVEFIGPGDVTLPHLQMVDERFGPSDFNYPLAVNIEDTSVRNLRSGVACCPENYCWNGNNCVEPMNENSQLVETTGENQFYRCIDGEWNYQPIKFDWNADKWGFCASEEQCLVLPSYAGGEDAVTVTNVMEGSSELPTCINNDEYLFDHSCNQGNWSSRTKTLANEVLGILNEGDNNYTLLCTNPINAFLNLDGKESLIGVQENLAPESIFDNPNKYQGNCFPNIQDHELFADSPVENTCINNVCILQRDGDLAFATTLNRPVDGFDSFLSTLGTDIDCSREGEGFVSCTTSNGKVWYHKELNAVIFAKDDLGFEPGVGDNIATFFSNLFRSGAVLEEQRGFVEEAQNFRELYLKDNGDQQVRAVQEIFPGVKQTLVAEYTGFSDDLCKFTEERFIDEEEAHPELLELASGTDYLACSYNETAGVHRVEALHALDFFWPQLTGSLR
ncbi:hypothetical protein HOC32_04845 [Candidatus Woesearchaeota archaeon]|nr:hypothetical protein [Candidatus Woesearchaeota archaeon]